MESKNLDRYIFSNATIYSPKDRKSIEGNLLVADGIIKDLNYKGESDDYNIIDCSGKIICPSFLDLRSHFGEPGFEDSESLITGSQAALAGGYSKVCILPNTDPVLDSLESIESLNNKMKNLDIDLYPIGSITKNIEGLELSEIGLMVSEGVVAISDAHKNVKNSQVFRNALEYAKMFDIPIINHSEDAGLTNDGIAHESYFSTNKGLPSNPSISETTAIFRDLEIANYVNGRIHIPHVSSKDSVDLIEKYKNMGTHVTAEVTPHHLGLSELELNSFDALYKISPPLRSKEDSLGLIEGLKRGVIDCIASDHCPQKIEDKESDLLNSKFGVIGLESAFPYSHQVLSQHGFSLNDVIDLFTIKPSQVMNIDLDMIEEGKESNFTIINPNIEWVFDKKSIFSMSKNSALIGKPMKGKIEFVACKNKIHAI